MHRLRAFAAGTVIALTVGLLVPIVGSVVVTPTTAAAAEAANFDPGYIISDELFYSSSAMSVDAIQRFLNSKVTNCRSGYTCLKDYTQVTPGKAADRYCPGGFGVENFTAAQIIEGVSRSCGVSAKVLLVLLEKEQALVTDTYPTARQYRSATGYGCPDTADCDATYYGFFNQVYSAARQFKNYQANATNWRYQAGRSNYIQYNPNTTCGGTDVFIQNQATAGLYVYTPYQPNASALANLYGSGDGCGAYGNRNFWRMYTDWFGPTNTFPVSGAIGDYYNARGGVGNAALGAPTGRQYVVDASTYGWTQTFANGSIYWSSSTGAASVSGGIGLEYIRRGGPTGTGLGFPTGDQVARNDSSNGWYQDFRWGRMYWTPAYGAEVVLGSISALLIDAGGPSASNIGYPTGPEVPEQGGGSQPFERGRVFWNSRGTFAVVGAISTAYDGWGGPTGSGLGFPTAAQTQVAGGVAQTFDFGTVYSSQATGTWRVSGGIGAGLDSLGGLAASGLGLPVAAQRPEGEGWYQQFQNGSLYWSPAGGARRISGGLGAAYLERGGPQGSGLGYPLTEQTQSGSTWTQQFSQGSMTWSNGSVSVQFTSSSRAAYYANGGPLGPLGSATAARTAVAQTDGWVERYTGGSLYGSASSPVIRVSGGIGQEYERAGGPVGSGLGFPVAESRPLGDSVQGWGQRFQNGSLYWTSQGGGVIVRDALGKGFDASGGPLASPLGYPVSSTPTTTGSVVTQPFQGGTAASTGAGFFAVSGGIGAGWVARGGLGSYLGAPVSDQFVSGNGGWTQRFQGGILYWTPRYGTQASAGGIGVGYTELGGPLSVLGYPVDEQRSVTGGWVQGFERGRVYWSSANGPIGVSGGIGYDYFARGSELSAVGFPAGPQYPMGDGGWVQAYTGGRLYWSGATGTRLVSGGIGAAFVAAGGPSGSGIGYPTTEQANVGGGNYVQYFQRGRINWLAGTGAVLSR